GPGRSRARLAGPPILATPSKGGSAAHRPALAGHREREAVGREGNAMVPGLSRAKARTSTAMDSACDDTLTSRVGAAGVGTRDGRGPWCPAVAAPSCTCAVGSGVADRGGHCRNHHRRRHTHWQGRLRLPLNHVLSRIWRGSVRQHRSRLIPGCFGRCDRRRLPNGGVQWHASEAEGRAKRVHCNDLLVRTLVPAHPSYVTPTTGVPKKRRSSRATSSGLPPLSAAVWPPPLSLTRLH